MTPFDHFLASQAEARRAQQRAMWREIIRTIGVLWPVLAVCFLFLRYANALDGFFIWMVSHG